MIKSILALSFLLLATSHSYAETCKEKIADIQMKFEDALKRQNTKEVIGLEKVLKETKANCTDAKLAASHQQKIKAKQQKVDEKTKELEELKKMK